jgi:hypothetical protein
MAIELEISDQGLCTGPRPLGYREVIEFVALRLERVARPGPGAAEDVDAPSEPVVGPLAVPLAGGTGEVA